MRTFMNELVSLSADIISHYYKTRNFEVEQKANNTPVTLADKKAEEVMRKHIEKHYPDHGIIGEEYGSTKPDAEYVWVLDPIDGTIAFIHGVPLFVTLIALLKNGQPILGAINQPIAQLKCEGDNTQAWLNDEPVSMRKPNGLNECTLLCTDIVKIGRMHNKQGFQDLLDKVKLFRTWGDGFAYLLLASGRADIMVDAQMAPWDILPVIPVVRGAGAIITTFKGDDAVSGTSALCAHPSIFKEVHETVNQLHKKSL